MLIDAILIIVLILCFITDIREQKIYNKIVMPSILTVLILNIFFYGYNGFKFSALGFLTGLAILLIPYLLGGMGAGDVKLLAFVGAAKGVLFVLNSSIYMAIVGGIISLVILILNKQAIVFFKSIFSWIVSFSYKVRRELKFSNSETSKKFPYGTAIVAGALICLLFKGAWIL
jgi:prepilin peptidase CpaA